MRDLCPRSRMRSVWATEIVGVLCDECGAPYTIAWRETEGRRYRYRVDVEVLVGCDCEHMSRHVSDDLDPEEWM